MNFVYLGIYYVIPVYHGIKHVYLIRVLAQKMSACWIISLDGSHPVNVPLVTEANGLIHHNDLFCHIFDALTKSQGMAALVIGAKSNTICGLLKSTFPAIKTTNDSPTPYVTPATVAYIHALIIDSVTANPTESASQRALLCENVARQELESIDLALFHDELLLAFWP